MNLQFIPDSKIQVSEGYQVQTKLEKPGESSGWSLKKTCNPKRGGIFVKSIQGHCNPSDDLTLKKEKR